MEKEKQAGIIAGFKTSLIMGIISSLLLLTLNLEILVVLEMFALIILQGLSIGYLLSIIDKKYSIGIEQKAMLSASIIFIILWFGSSIINKTIIDIFNLGRFLNLLIWGGLISYFYKKQIEN